MSKTMIVRKSGALIDWSAVIFFALFVLAVCPVRAGGQCPTWSQRTPENSPPERTEACMVYDKAHAVSIMFGGRFYDGTISTLFDDTWQWDGTNWTQLFPSTVPSARRGHSMAYDSAHGKVLMFGGGTPGVGVMNDTWEWDGVNWTQRFPTTVPAARSFPGMAYDAGRGVIVLFGGGTTTTNPFNDTYEWNGTNWTLRNPATKPPARGFPSMIYDERRGVSVMFGGKTIASDPAGANDTWEWNGTNWAVRTPPHKPAARMGHQMAYEVTSGVSLLFGGIPNVGSPNYFGDCWVWDGADWTQRITSSSPAARFSPAMTYDVARSKVVLNAGHNGVSLNDTWEFADCPADVVPPSPNPETFAINPQSASTTSIHMQATLATEADSPPVQYLFDYVSGSGGHDSSWQASNDYIDAGLTPNSFYSYRCKARDSSSLVNETGYSATVLAGTAIETPISVSFGAIDSSSIVVNADGSFSNSGLGSTGFYFEMTPAAGAGANAWVSNPTTTVTGLTPCTQYTFRAKARNFNADETPYTSQAIQVTSGCTSCALLGDVNGSGSLEGGDIAGFVHAKLGAPAPGEFPDCANYATGTLGGDVALFANDLLSP
jgi:hypothetical protein